MSWATLVCISQYRTELQVCVELIVMRHASIAHVVDMVKRQDSEEKQLLCADGQIHPCMYLYKLA